MIMTLAAPSRSRRTLLGVIAAFAFMLPAACGDSATCAGPETVHLKMSGTCGGGLREFDLLNAGCRLGVMGTDLGLPTAGAVARTGDVIREGEWQIFGCLDGGPEPCPEQFRRCSTKRVAWQLDLSCLDGQGNLACQAVLTE